MLDLPGKAALEVQATDPNMKCPYCDSPLLEDSPSCPRCGLTLEKAGAFFGTVPRLLRGVSDAAGVLKGADIRRLKAAILKFERRFPQAGFTVAFIPLPEGTPGATYTYWVFNRCNPAGELHQGSSNRHIFLLVDTAGRDAWLTVGYGLEPFIGEQHLSPCLAKAQPHLAAGAYPEAVITLLEELETTFRTVVAELPRTFGLQRLETARETGEPAEAEIW